MKKLKYILIPLLIAPLVTGCEIRGRSSGRGGRNNSNEYTITFHQDEGNRNDYFTFYVGTTTESEVRAFQENITLNQKRGYDVRWEDYNVSNFNSNFTIRAIYTLHEYSITFKYEEQVLGTANYTVKSTSVNEPALPTTPGYTYAYEHYNLADHAEDFVVHASKTINKQATISIP